jgi:tRNA uridine 5-carboxymethylaminomethyl modification enzyme
MVSLSTKTALGESTSKSLVLFPAALNLLTLILLLHSAFYMLRYPGVTTESMKAFIPDLTDIDPQLLSRIDIEGHYHPHLTRQEADVKVFMEDESLMLDPGMVYADVPGLSSEVIEKLSRVRPTTIGAAKRIEGMTPTSVVYLLKYAKRTWNATTATATATAATIASTSGASQVAAA